jgi:hypothetical protein
LNVAVTHETDRSSCELRFDEDPPTDLDGMTTRWFQLDLIRQPNTAECPNRNGRGRCVEQVASRLSNFNQRKKETRFFPRQEAASVVLPAIG